MLNKFQAVDEMLRYLLIIIIAVHAAIHLLGFVKAFGIAEVEQLSAPISKQSGVFWLTAFLLFGIALLLYILEKGEWWIPGILAIILSQILIVIFWEDAKYGTIANGIILLPCIVAFGNWQFDRMVSSEVHSLLPASTTVRTVIDAQALTQLPAAVRNWVRASDMLGKRKIQKVHLRQSGKMRTSPGGNWLNVKAEQWFTLDDPGFIWSADVGRGNVLQFSGLDQYKHGEGNMLIKAYSLFPIVNEKGPKIDQGVAVRFLAEMVWFPSFASSDYIEWEELDAQNVKAHYSYQNFSVTGVFTFDQKGRATRFKADRFYGETGKKEKWIIDIDPESYQSFSGILIPTRSEVSWQLGEGDFTWYKLKIADISFS